MGANKKMRPLYETEADLNREYDCVERLMSAWKCNARKLPISYQLDYMFERNKKPTGWCEIKCRNLFPYTTLFRSQAGVRSSAVIIPLTLTQH